MRVGAPEVARELKASSFASCLEASPLALPLALPLEPEPGRRKLGREEGDWGGVWVRVRLGCFGCLRCSRCFRCSSPSPATDRSD